MALSRKQKLDQKSIAENEALKVALLSKISTYGEYSQEEKELIINVNEIVMSVDGTAEQWGGYDFNPLDYIDKSIEIFDLIKDSRKGF